MAGPYHLDVSAQVARQIKGLLQLSRQIGIAQHVHRIIQRVFRRLATNPRTIGEHVENLDFLDLEVRAVHTPPIAIKFAVHDDPAFVVIMQIEMPILD